MKKIYKLLISFVLIISMLMVTACSQSFGGNYKEITEEEKATLLTNVAAAKIEDVQADGFSMKMDMEMTEKDPISQKDVTTTMNMDFKSKVKDDKLTMYGEAHVKAGEESSDVILYYAVDTMYMNMKMDRDGTKGEVKYKMAMPFDLGDLGSMAGGSVELDLTLADFIADYTSETCKMTVAKADNQTRVKLEITDTEGTGEVYFVYNKDYKMVAVKMSMKGEGMSMSMEIAPYSGSVKTLKGLDEYFAPEM